MALSIKDPEADRLARQVSRLTGESLTAVVVEALRERLLRLQRRREPALGAELLAIGQRCAALPIVDGRTAEEILGYDENGLPR
jgi:antitoxin VapB